MQRMLKLYFMNALTARACVCVRVPCVLAPVCRRRVWKGYGAIK